MEHHMENIKINLSLVIALVIQTSGLVYWAAQQASSLEQLQVTVSKLENKVSSTEIIHLQRDIQDLQKEIATLKSEIQRTPTFDDMNRAIQDSDAAVWREFDWLYNQLELDPTDY